LEFGRLCIECERWRQNSLVSVTESRRAKDGNLNRESEKKKIIENKTTTNENNFFYLKKALIKM